jgi:hypothetical protein
METGLRTADALKYAGLERQFWNSIVQRQLYTDLPVAQPGRAGRLFVADDLVALDIFSELLRIGVMKHVAAHVAGNLRACLREDTTVRTLHLITVADATSGITRPEIVKTPPTDAVVLWTLDIAKARALAHQAITAKELNP